MNCGRIAQILDDRSRLTLAAADRAAVDEHLTCCDDCAAAWGADDAVLALPIPRTPADLLERALRASVPSGHAPARRGRAWRTLGPALLVAGAALAAAAVVKWSQPDAERSAPSATSPAPAPAGEPRSPEAQSTASPAPTADDSNDRISLPDAEYFDLIRVPPRYPPMALAAQREGSVKLEFGITKDGAVTDVKVLESSDPEFEPHAALAVSRWKYMPRIAGGKRVAVPRLETTIRFSLGGGPQTVPEPPPQPPEHGLTWEEFNERMAPAWDCAGEQHLRCAELALDELTATYNLDDGQAADVANFYGYIYTQYEDYGRAIAAYQTAIHRAGALDAASLSLGHLYFTQHRYDSALATLEAYDAAARKAGVKWPGADDFIAKLKELLSVP